MQIYHYIIHIQLNLFLLCFVDHNEHKTLVLAYEPGRRNVRHPNNPPNSQSYLHRKVNIRMSKLSTLNNLPEKHPNLALHSNGTKTEDNDKIPLQVGGLGLASSRGHNRISLGSLSNRGLTNTSPSSKKFETNSDALVVSKEEATPPVWPNEHPKETDMSKVNMRILGKLIDLRAVNYLHPDVTPIKARKLRKILSGNLDKDWTSETAPRVLRQRGVSGSVNGVIQPNHKLITEVNALNFTLQHDTGAYFSLPEAQLKPFQKWLIDKANCEMDYIWEDLGPLFWPRWIRRGVCINRPDHSCSWPPGMKCRPSGSRALKLLHWKCEDAAYWQSRERAAEQRNRRRTAVTAANTFHSKFLEMQPVNHKLPPDQASNSLNQRGLTLPRLSLRDTLGTINVAPQTGPRIRLHSRSVNWDRSHPDQNRFARSKDERRKRRARRLIKRLSVTANGYHCYWQVQKYLISDQCACLCS